jgi:hypothetical protein
MFLTPFKFGASNLMLKGTRLFTVKIQQVPMSAAIHVFRSVQAGLASPWNAVQAIGAELDLSDKGLGIRSRRYALLADDGVVRSSFMRAFFLVKCPDELPVV